MDSLNTLILAGIPIDDADLVALMKLKQLKILCLLDTGVSETGASQLREALPDTEVKLNEL